MAWQAHGEWQIRVVDRVLMYRVDGAWNEEAAGAFSDAAVRAAVPLAGDRWAIFGDLRNWQLATLDCEPHIRHISALAIAHGCVLQCLIPGEGPLKHELLERMVPETDRFRRALVADVEAAVAILREEGFEHEAERLRREGPTKLLVPEGYGRATG